MPPKDKQRTSLNSAVLNLPTEYYMAIPPTPNNVRMYSIGTPFYVSRIILHAGFAALNKSWVWHEYCNA